MAVRVNVGVAWNCGDSVLEPFQNEMLQPFRFLMNLVAA
jgi:hypothetical protein